MVTAHFSPDEVYIDSFDRLQQEVTKASVHAQEHGLHITPATFDAEIASAIVGFATAVTLAVYNIPKLPDGDTAYYISEGTDRRMVEALAKASEQFPGVQRSLARGISDSFATIHRSGVRALYPTISTNVGASKRPDAKWWHKDGGQTSVVIAPDPFKLHAALSKRQGRRSNYNSYELPSGIVGIRGPGSIFPLRQKGIAHDFENPESTWRHSVVANAMLRSVTSTK